MFGNMGKLFSGNGMENLVRLPWVSSSTFLDVVVIFPDEALVFHFRTDTPLSSITHSTEKKAFFFKIFCCQSAAVSQNLFNLFL